MAKWQSEVDFQRSGALIHEAMNDRARFLGVIDEKRILRVSGRCHIQVWTGQKQPWNRYAQFLNGIVALIPCTGIADTGHSVFQKHIGQFDAATMEMRVDQAGEQRQATSIERFAGGRSDASTRPGRDDPVSFDHDYGVSQLAVHPRPSMSRAPEMIDRSDCKKHGLFNHYDVWLVANADLCDTMPECVS